MDNLQRRIDQRLNALFNFKKVGDWYREGICPQCNRKELWTHAINPRVVACSRLSKCGYSEHVKDICEELFKKWSEDHPQTEANPHAAADAYLQIGRGLDISKIKSSYTQETHTDKSTGHSTATVRFTLSNGDWWQRFIDETERFEKNFNWNFGAKYKGLWWQPPQLDILDCKEIWITEGILKALALIQQGIPAVSAMSCNNYPTLELEKLEKLFLEQKVKKPKLVWAFDNDNAGKNSTVKFHQQAIEAGWSSTAAQPPFSRAKIDWNDLLERNLLNPDDIKKYRHYGQLLIARSAAEAGLLIYNFNDAKRKTFYFNHQSRLYWFDLDVTKYNKAMEELETQSLAHMTDEEIRQQALVQCSAIKEICNAQLTPLYFQRDKITGDSAYYFNVTAPWGEVKTEFTPDQLASRSRFKPAVMGSLSGAMWTGPENQLETFIKRETEGLKEVETIDWIGYSPDHHGYIFNKFAVHKGNIIKINDQDYFKVGRKEVKSLAHKPEIMINPKDNFNPAWFKNFHKVRGAKGLIVLAWWTGSYFAEQIRTLHSSYPFIEVVGEAGAGKSRMIEFMWKLSGRKEYEGFDAQKATSVAVYRNFAQVSNLPVVLIEGDRNDDDAGKKPKFLWDELKDAFNGRSIRSKGLKTGGNETYEPPFRGAIMISQNTTIKASEAIITRTLHLTFDRKGQTLATKRLVDELDRISVEQACTYMTHCLRKEADILETYSRRLGELESEYHQHGITHTRIALCHAQIAALIESVAKHVLDGVLELEDVLEAQAMLIKMAEARVLRLSADHPDVDRFWETYEYLEQNRDFALNHHAKHLPTVAININEFYKAAMENRQMLPDSNVMKDLLANSNRYKFVDKNRQVRSAIKLDVTSPTNHRNVKCWIFQKPAI